MKAIVFDFDGVLADTYAFNKELSKEVGHDVSHEDFKAHHDGNVFEKPKIPFTEESANRFHSLYLEQIHTAKPFFSGEILKGLSEKFSLYIISSSKEKSIIKYLRYHNLEYFEEVLGVDFHKSKVEKFKYLFQKHNLKPEEMLFVTDTLGDILEANKVNIRTIAVDFGFHEKERLEKGNPFRIISEFSEIPNIIKQL